MYRLQCAPSQAIACVHNIVVQHGLAIDILTEATQVYDDEN